VHGRSTRLAGGELGFDQALQRLHEAAAQRLAPEERPFLEGGAAFDREAVEKISAVEPHRLVQLGCSTGGLEGMRIDADAERRCQRQGRAIRLDRIRRKCRMELVQRAPQPAACRLDISLRPQQGRDRVAADGATRIGQVGDERQPLAQGEVDRASVETHRGKAEQLKLQARHHERLILSLRAGDGRGTRP
jgi:hypothetical protein